MPQLCIDCKHFAPSPDFNEYDKACEFGRCRARVLPGHDAITLVDGRALPRDAYPYASTMRMPGSDCSPEAKLFTADDSIYTGGTSTTSKEVKP